LDLAIDGPAVSSHAKYIPAVTLAHCAESTSVSPSRSPSPSSWRRLSPSSPPLLPRPISRRLWRRGLRAPCGAGAAAQKGPGVVASAPWPPGPVWSWHGGGGGSGAMACSLRAELARRRSASAALRASVAAPRRRVHQHGNPSTAAPPLGRFHREGGAAARVATSAGGHRRGAALPDLAWWHLLVASVFEGPCPGRARTAELAGWLLCPCFLVVLCSRSAVVSS
jgi:hypothetical protein